MTTPVSQRSALLDALNSVRFELVPIPALTKEVNHLPAGASVTITASPSMGIERTVETAEVLAQIGFRPVPHLAARQIRSRSCLSGYVDRLIAANVDDVIVLAGDAKSPAGPFSSALELLEALEVLGRPFPAIGITGYPEGHPFIDERVLQEALLAKATIATYLVTQLCFSADPIRDWLNRTRALGVSLPVYLGIPGKVSQKRLLAMAAKVGVGDSLRFFRRNTRSLLRMALAQEFDPEDLVRDLEPLLASAHEVIGFHIYTFNALFATESWRRELIHRLEHGDHQQ